MLLSKNEMFGWGIGAAIIVVMGYLAFHGPFNHINKAQATSFAPAHVKIVTDATTVGRYVPATITVHIGQKIIFANDSNVDHTVTEQNDKFDSRNLGTGGQTWTYIPAKSGTSHYICSYHPLMHGTIVVLK